MYVYKVYSYPVVDNFFVRLNFKPKDKKEVIDSSKHLDENIQTASITFMCMTMKQNQKDLLLMMPIMNICRNI